MKGKTRAPAVRKADPNSSDKEVTKIKLLEVLILDDFGPYSPLGPNGTAYHSGLMDLFSRFCWLLRLKNRTGIYEELRKFFKMLKSKGTCVLSIIVIHDDAPEFVSKKFKDVLAEFEIVQTDIVSSPYNPHHHVWIERHWQTLAEHAHAMMIASGRPRRFFAFAIEYANLTHNCLPCSYGGLWQVPTKYFYMFICNHNILRDKNIILYMVHAPGCA